MPAVGTELCGQAAFGGDPFWEDVDASAVSRAASHAAIQRLPQWGVSAFGSGDADGAIQRLLQCGAAAGAGVALIEAMLQRCPQLCFRVEGTAWAWFVPIAVMGGTSLRGVVQRLVQHALAARVLSAQSAVLVPLRQCRSIAGGFAADTVAASVLGGLCSACAGLACPKASLAGTWTIGAVKKAQAEVEGSLATCVPFRPASGIAGSRARGAAHGLAYGIGPSLFFPATAPESGEILFEVEL